MHHAPMITPISYAEAYTGSRKSTRKRHETSTEATARYVTLVRSFDDHKGGSYPEKVSSACPGGEVLGVGNKIDIEIELQHVIVCLQLSQNPPLTRRH
jgi:hypothetical protein